MKGCNRKVRIILTADTHPGGGAAKGQVDVAK